MTLRDLIVLVWKNLNRMRGRVIMTALGVMIGTAAIVVLMALAAGLQQSAIGDLSQFGAINQITVFSGSFFGSMMGSTQPTDPLNERTLADFAAIDGVIAVTPRLSLSAPPLFKLNRLQGAATVYGIDPRTVDDLELEAEQGTARLSRGVVLVGARVAEAFTDTRAGSRSSEPPDLFGQTLVLEMTRIGEDGRPSTRSVRVRVGGVLAERGGQDDYTIFMTLSDVEELNAWYTGDRPDRRREGYSEVLVITEKDPALSLEVEAQIIERGYFAFSAGSVLQGLNATFLIIQAVLGGIGAIALLVAAIGIANTMIMSVLERTREIGVLKAVGAANRDVMSIFITEAGAIGLLGGLAGVGFGWLVTRILDILIVASIQAQNAAQGAAAELPSRIAVIPAWLPPVAISVAVVVGLVAGIVPALRAVQLNPVVALKYE
ncbi:MAG: ABC transporter permease [Anaerolineae bacterium]